MNEYKCDHCVNVISNYIMDHVCLCISAVQDLVKHIMLFTAEGGNIDCVHPVQTVVEHLCGDQKTAYAQKIEDWFESYAKMRGNVPRTFKPMSAIVRG